MNAPVKAKAVEAEPLNVHRRLSLARQLFHATELRKSGHNKFADYRYFELGDFLVPALRIFDEVGLSAVVSFDADTANMRIVNMDTPAETITITSPMGSAALKGCHEVQNIGAVETYQRRYLWVAALEIVEHDALEATTGKAEPEKRKASGKASDADVAQIIQLCDAVGGNQSTLICKAYQIESIPELTPSQAQAVIGKLTDKLAAKAKAETDAKAKENA